MSNSYTKALKRTPSPSCKMTHIGDQVSAHFHSETQAGGHILSPSHSLDQSHGSGTSLYFTLKTTRSHSEVIGGEVLHTKTLKQTGSPSHITTKISNHVSVLALALMMGVIFSLSHIHQIKCVVVVVLSLTHTH